MDDLARFNKERWEELARANIAYSRPMLNLDSASARALVDPEGMAGNVDGREVLCLAAGGGQQSAAFALLGARVTVLDLCDTQLARDREAAAHYGFSVDTIQADMRDLSRFADGSFDLIWHAHALNFVPDPHPVFAEAARVLRPDGLYRLNCTNPFFHGVEPESDWTGSGYVLQRFYVDGAEIKYDDPYWGVRDAEGVERRVLGPHEFRHTLSTLANGLIGNGLAILGIWEEAEGDPSAQPGTWEHMQAMLPPWLTFWARRRPADFTP